jgi:hypothetical protein
MVASAVVTAIAAAAIWIVVRDDPSERGYASHYPAAGGSEEASSLIAMVREALSYRNTWLLFLASGAFSESSSPSRACGAFLSS